MRAMTVYSAPKSGALATPANASRIASGSGPWASASAAVATDDDDEEGLRAPDDVLRRPAEREQPAGEAAQAPQPVQDRDEPEGAVRLGEVDDAELRRPDAEPERDRDDEQRAHAGVGDRSEDRRRRAAGRPADRSRLRQRAERRGDRAPAEPVATSAASGTPGSRPSRARAAR